MAANRRGEIKMTDEEIDDFLTSERTATMCTMHPDGSIHAVAMWYCLLDGQMTVETKAKSQKVQNLKRDPRITFLVEAGDRYEELRGVEIVGEARIIEDDERLWEFGKLIWEKYMGPYDDSQQEALALMLRKRVLVTADPKRVVSWDHRKL